MKYQHHLIAAALACAFASVAQAQTIRVANQGDALSLDPHSFNESLQLDVLGNVFEGLVGRDKNLNLVRSRDGLEADLPDGLALRIAQGRAVPRWHTFHS